jgi:hypothetical protein
MDNLLLGLLLLLFLTPVGWGLIVILIGVLLTQTIKGIKKLVTTDYKPVENKRAVLLEELEKEGDIYEDHVAIPEKED